MQFYKRIVLLSKQSERIFFLVYKTKLFLIIQTRVLYTFNFYKKLLIKCSFTQNSTSVKNEQISKFL